MLSVPFQSTPDSFLKCDDEKVYFDDKDLGR